ncbi:MAG: UDP-N-acetylglucosamine 1-carboxyvinyltransferase [Clostridia bacterium]|nr:UDP-N-acetylglucosamine 1-carboxyvinyltransferase [Clostridia bacterium]MBQ4603672.1 UDP-N-acetylglucosamine 1-carboxyvinyltransferase [Clostridia bacterium]
MEKLIINGGRVLDGNIVLQGSKNSALPILAATVAVGGTSVIHNCPKLTDISAALKILEHTGCKIKREGHTVVVDASSVCRYDIPEKMMREMRSSIIFLGALLARFGFASVTPPGGCEIGLRPIDLHLSSLRRMGVEITENGGVLECRVQERFRGCHISLAFPSVGATENIMLASLSAKGETVITNAAREPEIKDLADFLIKCGAKISGAGQSVIRINGGEKLNAAEHRIIPDRIVASTYMACAACTGGRVAVSGVEKEHLLPVISAFEASGCKIAVKNEELLIKAPERLSRIKTLRTMPYPGFPTDSQALVMAMLVTADGTSIITEKIFENRFRHVPELIKMGADIRVEDGCVAVIEGVERLRGARVSACDLRGGCALAVAALGAEGESVIESIYHIDRGCESIEESLSLLGADIKRTKI